MVERLPDTTYLDLTTQPSPGEEDWEEAPGVVSAGVPSSSSGPSGPTAPADLPTGEHPDVPPPGDPPETGNDQEMPDVEETTEDVPPMDTPFMHEEDDNVTLAELARRSVVRKRTPEPRNKNKRARTANFVDVLGDYSSQIRKVNLLLAQLQYGEMKCRSFLTRLGSHADENIHRNLHNKQMKRKKTLQLHLRDPVKELLPR